MEKLFDMKILGVRWVSNNPHGACKRCAALHGKELYYKPKDGQLSMDQLPQLPVHPNCRCTTIPITEQKVLTNEYVEPDRGPEEFREPVRAEPHLKPYMQGEAYTSMGLIWRNDWRFGEGPIWGKYCGESWSIGADLDDHDLKPTTTKTPEDSLDGACQKHDRCYDERNKLPCDEALVRRLEALGPDPSKWPYPPATEGEYEYAERYRKLAILAFKIRAAFVRDQNRGGEGYNHEIPISP